MSALGLAPRLAVARLRDRQGGRWPDLLAVAAQAVCAWLALTVAGGTWLFVRRAAVGDVPGLELDGREAGIVLQTYVVLAVLACALLTVPVLSLGAAAARLGAASRAKRLASLRLVGVTGGEVVVMSVVESAVQAVAGIIVGGLLWALTLPLWTLVSFQRSPIGLAEMVPPWWLALLVVATMMLLAAVSTAIGLRAVRVTPLGVVARQTPRGLRLVRFLAVGVALVGFAWLSMTVRLAGADTAALVAIGVSMAVVVGSVNLVGPLVLQLIAYGMSRTGDVARLLAFKRVLDDPRASWRSIGPLALTSLVAGYVCFAPLTMGSADPATAMLLVDTRTGVGITLGVALVLAAAGTAITQAASVFDRREQLVSLDRMGVPMTTLDAARRWEVLLPLLFVSLGSAGVGAVLTLPLLLAAPFRVTWVGVAMLSATLAGGVLLAWGAAELGRPLTRLAVAGTTRRDD